MISTIDVTSSNSIVNNLRKHHLNGCHPISLCPLALYVIVMIILRPSCFLRWSWQSGQSEKSSLSFSRKWIPSFELFLSHSFIVADKKWKVQLFTDLQRLRLLPHSNAPKKSDQQLEHFLLFLALFSFLHFRGKNSDYSWSAFWRQTTQSCMILPPPAVQIGRLSAKRV